MNNLNPIKKKQKIIHHSNHKLHTCTCTTCLGSKKLFWNQGYNYPLLRITCMRCEDVETNMLVIIRVKKKRGDELCENENENTLQVLVSAEVCVGDSVFSSEGCRRRLVHRRKRRRCCRCQICFHVLLLCFFANHLVRSYSPPFYSHLPVRLY